MEFYKKLKDVFFYAFLAGYKAGYFQTNDSVSAFDEWWKDHVEGE